MKILFQLLNQPSQILELLKLQRERKQQDRLVKLSMDSKELVGQQVVRPNQLGERLLHTLKQQKKI